MSAGLVVAGEREEPVAAPSRRSILRRLWNEPRGRVGLLVLAVVILLGVATLAGLSPAGPDVQNPLVTLKPPSAAHPFGTDQYGRDLFSRVQAGIVLSLQVAVVAVAICTVVGSIAGVAAGFFGGWVSGAVTGGADLLFAIPSILLALVIVSVLGHGWLNSAIAVGVGYIPIFVRVVRGPVLAIREADFVRAGRVLGFSRTRLLLRHVLPSVSGILAIQVTLALGWAVLTEASLDFLGLGPAPPAATLGLMVSDGTTMAGIAWWNLAFPALAVVALVIGFNLVGDGLRDALDPARSGAAGRRLSRAVPRSRRAGAQSAGTP
jgi:peptide/nickel transport system permease protein